MYKVLIVDDERLIRITLKNMLDWKALDCEVIATVKDGEEALRVFDELHPEIVITDLKMPGMDGIELIKKIKERNKNTQVIALSNYSDFEYVRDAMKAGAFDYLLKVTLEKSELQRIIEQVKESCVESSKNDHDEYEAAINKLRECIVLIKNKHMVKEEKLQEILSLPMFDKYSQGFQMGYFRVDNINYLYQTKVKDHEGLHHNLKDLIKESIPIMMGYHLIFISNHSGIIMFESKEKLRVLNICHSIIRNIAQYLDIHMSISLSDIIPSTDNFYEQFKLLLKAHARRFYLGEGSLIQVEENDNFNELDMNKVDFHLQILDAMQMKNFTKVYSILEDIMYFMQEKEISPQSVKEYFMFIFHNIEGNVMAKGLRHAFPFDSITAQIPLCETSDKLEEIVKGSFQTIETWLQDSSSQLYRKEILDAIEYIESNIHRKLTLKMIADHLHMNESTLSRMFKSETGVNVNYYVNERKMKKAMELLSNQDSMIKDVALAVGIEDQLYFNKVFKKYYNISPSEFKKQIHPNITE